MKKRLGLIALALFTALLVVAGYALWAAYQVPDFYRELEASTVAPKVRKDEAKKFTQQTLQLIDDVKQSRDWTHEFTQQQVNSWFVEELDGKYSDLLPEGAKDPRLKITPDSVMLGFRYMHSHWRGIVSLEVKPWVPQPNRLALQFSSVKAGHLPIPLDRILNQIRQNFETRGWHVEWRQAAGNDVLVIDFSRRPGKRSQLKSIRLMKGKVRINGKRGDQTQGS